MRLAEAITVTKRTPGPPCSVAVALNAIDDHELREDIEAWFAGAGEYDAADIYELFQSLGHRVAEQTIGRHRRAMQGYGNRCKCRP